MEIKDIRRARLQAFVDSKFDGVAKRFSDSIGMAQAQLAETLNGKRSFGEKLARSLEQKAGLPRGYLDSTAASGDLDGAFVSLGSSPEPADRAHCIKVQGVLSMDDDGFCSRENVRELKGTVPWMGEGEVEVWQVYGDSVQKRYPDGWFIFVSKDWPLEAGDDVMVELKDGRITLAEFTSERDGILSLRRHDDDSRRSLPMGAVASVKAVVGMIHRSKFKPDSQ